MTPTKEQLDEAQRFGDYYGSQYGCFEIEKDALAALIYEVRHGKTIDPEWGEGALKKIGDKP